MNDFTRAIGILMGSCDKAIVHKDTANGIALIELKFLEQEGTYIPDMQITYPLDEQGEEAMRNLQLISTEATEKAMVADVIMHSESLGSEHYWDEEKSQNILCYGYGLPGNHLVLSVTGEYHQVETWINSLPIYA